MRSYGRRVDLNPLRPMSLQKGEMWTQGEALWRLASAATARELAEPESGLGQTLPGAFRGSPAASTWISDSASTPERQKFLLFKPLSWWSFANTPQGTRGGYNNESGVPQWWGPKGPVRLVHGDPGSRLPSSGTSQGTGDNISVGDC